MTVIDLYRTTPHTCGYFPDRQSTSLIADPNRKFSVQDFSLLMRNGFRRSGRHLYRPHCSDCRDCLSLRIPAQRFTPNRSQRRNLRRNHDLTVQQVAPDFHPEHFELYTRYLNQCHPGGGMDNPDADSYRSFLVGNYCNTFFAEFRAAKQLLAVAVIDQLTDGLSAVYTFYDPAAQRRGLGTFAILWQLDACKRRQRHYVYLGYWIRDCQKMAYKSEYRPLELYMNGRWTTLL